MVPSRLMGHALAVASRTAALDEAITRYATRFLAVGAR